MVGRTTVSIFFHIMQTNSTGHTDSDSDIFFLISISIFLNWPYINILYFGTWEIILGGDIILYLLIYRLFVGDQPYDLGPIGLSTIWYYS